MKGESNMRLSYQVSTPEVNRSSNVTAYQANLEQSFKTVAEKGYDGVELMINNPFKVDPGTINHLSSKYNLPISMICTGEIFGQSGISFTDKNQDRRQEAIEKVKGAVDLGLKVGVDKVNIGRVRGGFSLDGNHEEERKLSLNGIREVSKYALERDSIIALEPVNSIASNFINSTKDGIEIIDEIGISSLKLMLDSNHMFLDDIDPLESLEMAKDYLVFVHLVDSNRLYPGNCKFDFRSFIRKLDKIGYKGWLSVEVFQRPNQDVALEKSIEYLRPILDGLSKE